MSDSIPWLHKYTLNTLMQDCYRSCVWVLEQTFRALVNFDHGKLPRWSSSLRWTVSWCPSPFTYNHHATFIHVALLHTYLLAPNKSRVRGCANVGLKWPLCRPTYLSSFRRKSIKYFDAVVAVWRVVPVGCCSVCCQDKGCFTRPSDIGLHNIYWRTDFVTQVLVSSSLCFAPNQKNYRVQNIRSTMNWDRIRWLYRQTLLKFICPPCGVRIGPDTACCDVFCDLSQLLPANFTILPWNQYRFPVLSNLPYAVTRCPTLNESSRPEDINVHQSYDELERMT
jgi:hypothetical protein